MSLWEIDVSFRIPRDQRIKVEASDYEAACAEGQRVGREMAAKIGHGAVARARVERQLGEPWVYTSGWYDLHGPGPVVVFQRAVGNAFTEREVEVLGERLNTLGLNVEDHWNGVGCGQVSFRCGGRNGDDDMTDEQIAELTAPILKGGGDE